MIGGYFVTVISLDDNELIMTKCPSVTDNFFLISIWRRIAAVKKDRNKKTHHRESHLSKWSENQIIEIRM